MLDEERWILPDKLIERENRTIEIVDHGKINSRDHVAAYYAYKLGIDKNAIKNHAFSEEGMSKKYVAILNGFLAKNNVNLSGAVLDVGCGVGSITNAIREYNLNGRTIGIDICKSAIDVAKDKYNKCEFYCESADSLERFEDNYFDIIHAKEFYPFTRTNDVDFHFRFLKPFYRKLKPNGALILQMVDLEKGFRNTFSKRKKDLEKMGYCEFTKEVMMPLKLHCFSDILGGKLLYKLTSLGIMIAYTPINKKINYFYLMKKSANTNI